MKVTIPTPCHENWAAMTPEDKGRFCQVCSKSVRDFTNATDQEILNDISSNPNICGNFRVDQLDRNLSYSFLNSLFAKFAVGFVLTSGGLIAAQSPQPNHPVKTCTPTKVTGEIVVAQVPKKPVKIDKDTPFILGKMASTAVDRPNTPLYVVDGKIISENSFHKINPETIDKMKVLKDKDATSKYGERGKNGVVIVSLKGKRKK